MDQYLKKLHAHFQGLNKIYNMFDAIQTLNLFHAVEEVVEQVVKKLCDVQVMMRYLLTCCRRFKDFDVI